jgi:hypothetical protein
MEVNKDMIIISARINIIDITVFPQLTNRNLKMKGNSPFGLNVIRPPRC